MKTTNTNLQSELSGILKRKAIGPKGSRHLNEDDLEIIVRALKSNKVTLTSKAVLVTAVKILERNPLEKKLFNQWQNKGHLLPAELQSLLFGKGNSEFSKILQKILKGKDLDRKEASVAMSYLLDKNIPDYQKGVFLIGERLKRESFEENYAFFQTMKGAIQPQKVNVSLLVDLSDPYDGFVRYPIYTPFVASLLAALGISTYCHGAKKIAPKNGETIYRILDLAGKNPRKSITSVAEDLENEEVGWGYLDQSVYFPALSDLSDLRQKIVKRPFLATLEKLLQPLRTDDVNWVITGYVHSHYKEELAKLLENEDSLERALIVKGMEGSSQLDFRRKSKKIVLNKGEKLINEVRSGSINYPKRKWKQEEVLAEYVLESGLAALKGKKNTAREMLLYQAKQIVENIGSISMDNIELRAKKAIDSGKALDRWQNGCI